MTTINTQPHQKFLLSFYLVESMTKQAIKVSLCQNLTMKAVVQNKQKYKKGIFALGSH
jgi:hypothetical protein